jgi:hypothetical protein
MLDAFFAGQAGFSFLKHGIDKNAVYLAALSPGIPPEHVAVIFQEEAKLRSAGTDTIFCGPVSDNQGNVVYEDGYCPSEYEIYSMVNNPEHLRALSSL